MTSNQLKIIAMVAMTCDHVGLQILPQFPVLRIIGRLAMPVYAYMIAEGCRHTRDLKKYFLRIFGLGALCQTVYFLAMGSLYMSILITFSLSVVLIALAKQITPEAPQNKAWLATGISIVFFLCIILPRWLSGTDYGIDYGFYGVMLPLLIYAGRTKWEQLIGLTLGLVFLGLEYGGLQWYALATVPLLALYNGQRGTANIGKLFYWYYPMHLVIIQGISLLL